MSKKASENLIDKDDNKAPSSPDVLASTQKRGRGRPKKNNNDGKVAEQKDKTAQNFSTNSIEENVQLDNSQEMNDRTISTENIEKDDHGEEKIKDNYKKKEKKQKVLEDCNKETGVEEKDKDKKRHKWLYLAGAILSICAFAASLVGILMWWISVNVPMATPALSVKTVANKTYLFAEYNKDAVGYEFSVKENGVEKDFIIESESNMIETAKFLTRPTIFSIKVRSIGHIPGANSKWSTEITYVNKQRIKAPEIIEIQDQSNKIICWEKVENAEKYCVYYNYDNEEMKWFNIPSNYADGNNIVLNLSERTEFTGGTYNIFVVACASEGSEYFENSLISNVVSYTKIVTLPAITNTSFLYRPENKTFIMKYSKTYLNNVRIFDIKINGVEYALQPSQILSSEGSVLHGNIYTYTFTLQSFYDETKYGVPMTASIQVMSSSQYYNNSEISVLNF